MVLIYFCTESCGFNVKQLVFEKAALKHNIAAIRERAGEAAIFAVLAGDGYGAGLIELARFLRAEGIDRFAVTSPRTSAASGTPGSRTSPS